MMREVRLELARCHEYPEGSSSHGYELRAPLTPEGKLDRNAFAKHRHESGFRRFWGDAEESGQIRHGHRGWTLSFAAGGEDDEVIFRGDAHRFTVGEYVSIAERDGQTRTFRVVSVA
jgi:hypothetical protein